MINNNTHTVDIKKIGKIDPVTGLYNRYSFLYTVDLYINDCKNPDMEFAILLININGFKDINDYLGISIGDNILIEFSKRLMSVKTENYIISRINADEFSIFCKTKDADEIEKLAAEILAVIRVPFVVNNCSLHLNGRIGISKYPHDGEDVETLMRSADIAMSRAREIHGRKICFFSREMYEEIKDNFLYANHLTNSISNNELSIHYQPIFDIKDCKEIKGLEALLRWENCTLGRVGPDAFIPLAEKSGQIVSIGKWVLENVCKQINFWKMKRYKAVPVSVNISVKQLEQIEFSKKAIDILNNYNIDPNLIELEITESVSSGDIATISNNLRDLKEFGMTISMDDFGTGFSSLGQLDYFELDKIKIDKFFIDDVIKHKKKQKLLEIIISLGNSLDLTIVAEGIETKEQLSYLNSLDCQLGQGFLISRPLVAEEVEMFLK